MREQDAHLLLLPYSHHVLSIALACIYVAVYMSTELTSVTGIIPQMVPIYSHRVSTQRNVYNLHQTVAMLPYPRRVIGPTH